ncbi:uncharacterized protein PGRI_007760 [Penicillium griseofulvum]|uniref:Uncharacterized protein n=1 Tax=Penicillium patulum TaxID=5078 RepID=A0A135LXN5_PENPA|nr:uncharacterized protein PGRI_007760 [Penicillium griseofulvum]KXG53726.1 hypothetical protein PGRI_007760 [Penicillium griseofulvum]
MLFRNMSNIPGWLTLSGTDMKYLLIANLSINFQKIDYENLANLTNVSPKYASKAHRVAMRNLLNLYSTDLSLLSTLTKQKNGFFTEDTSERKHSKHPKHKTSMLLPDGSDEGSTVESSESEIDSPEIHQAIKNKGQAKYKDKGTKTTESESDNENSEVDESLPHFKLPRIQHRNTKHARRHSYTRPSAIGRSSKGDSALNAAIKSLSTRTDRASRQHERGVKRDRNPEFQDRSTEESAESSAEMNSSRASDSVKRKRLEKASGLANTSNNGSDIDEEVRHRSTRASAKAPSSKARSQNGNRKRLDKTNEHARSPIKDVVGEAMDGLTLGGDGPKTDGRTARNTQYDSGGDSMDEDNEEYEESEERETR